MKKKLGLVQMAPDFANPQKNYDNALNLMDQLMKEAPDILVLPETFNVGFFPKENLFDLADKDGLYTKEVLGQFAKSNHVNVVGGSVATVKQGQVFNTSYIFDRTGTCICEYDKIHGFTPFAEHEYFKGGDKSVIFELDGIKCSVIICYDLRFLELVRTVALKGAELLFVPAQWPLVRKTHWEVLNKARAIENQMYVCAVGACGYAGETKFGGNSLLVNPLGEEIIHLSAEEEVAVGEADFSIIKNVRDTINVFRDRRPETYEIN